MLKSSRKSPSKWLSISVHARILICALIGIACAVATGMFASWKYAPLSFWDATALLLLILMWPSLLSFSAEETQEYAQSEDPDRGSADIILIFASLASLAAVLALLVQSASSSGLQQTLQVAFGVASIVISWAVVHSLYALRYADFYFNDDAGIDFNTKAAPTYIDFAYLAFTIGMTYQVSDTSLTTPLLRRTVLKHALLSYLFGTAIIASAINFVASLAS